MQHNPLSSDQPVVFLDKSNYNANSPHVYHIRIQKSIWSTGKINGTSAIKR